MTSTMSEVFLHMLEPLLVAQHRCLARVGKMYVQDSLLKYNVFKIGLGWLVYAVLTTYGGRMG